MEIVYMLLALVGIAGLLWFIKWNIEGISRTYTLIEHQRWLFDHNIPEDMALRSMRDLERDLKQ